MALTVRSIIGILLERGGEKQDHARERYRRVARTGLTAGLNKVVSLAVSILTVRLTYQYLGAERYGMWMTISSAVLMLSFADFGMSAGLVNLVADALGKEDRKAAQRAAASALCILSAVAAVFAITALAVYPYVNAGRLFNVHSALAVKEAAPALLVFFFSFVLNLPLGVVRGTQTGMQNTAATNLWGIVGTALSLVALLVTIHWHAGLPLLVLGLSFPPVVASLLNGGELFLWSHPDLFPNPARFSRETAKRLLQTGLMYFLLLISFSIGLQTDNIVIAQIMGATAVSAFAVPARLFNMLLAFVNLISSTMWPAYADALARHDGPWIRRGFLRVVRWSMLITAVITVLFVVFGNAILHVWVGPQVHASLPLLILFGVQCMLYAYLQPIGFFLNGIGQLRAQVICGLIMTVVNLGLSIVLVKNYGIIGAVTGTVVALSVVQVVPLTWVVRRELSRLPGLAKEQHAAPAQS